MRCPEGKVSDQVKVRIWTTLRVRTRTRKAGVGVTGQGPGEGTVRGGCWSNEDLQDVWRLRVRTVVLTRCSTWFYL